ncbi:MAG: helix-turn-helix transcriptional regulator [Clostridia bacterium]|nr:helix-turn-helix transcriptional regulator [Clostridia bacterium]
MVIGNAFDPAEQGFDVRNLNFFVQSYFNNGSEVDFLTKPRVHHGLLYIRGCKLEVFLPSGEVICADRGDLLYLPKGSYYRSMFSEVSDSPPSLLFNFDLERDRKPYTFSNSVVHIESIKNTAISEIFERVMNEHSTYVGRMADFFGILRLLCENSLRGQRILAGKHSPVAPAIEYIELHSKEDIPIRLLAERCHLSESFFRKKFVDALGMSPKEYCLKKRLERAKLLIETGELNVSEVSYLLNFSSPSYFSRIFKKKFGVSPIRLLQEDI